MGDFFQLAKWVRAIHYKAVVLRNTPVAQVEHGFKTLAQTYFLGSVLSDTLENMRN